jgi:hypothetical protein
MQLLAQRTFSKVITVPALLADSNAPFELITTIDVLVILDRDRQGKVPSGPFSQPKIKHEGNVHKVINSKVVDPA